MDRFHSHDKGNGSLSAGLNKQSKDGDNNQPFRPAELSLSRICFWKMQKTTIGTMMANMAALSCVVTTEP